MRKSKAQTCLIVGLSIIFISGCFFIEPTYTKEKIAESIILLCKKEYNIAPKVWLMGETVQIYLPLPRLFSKDISWDKEIMESISKVMMASSRVVLSMKPRPQFMAMVASDTEEYGIDYTLINWIPDIVKFQFQIISRDEFFRRTVIKIEQNPLVLHDNEGLHIAKKEIHIEDFLAQQVKQRINLRFTAPDTKDYFKARKVTVLFTGKIFKIYVQIKQIKKLPKNKTLDIQKEIAKILAYVTKEYETKEFLAAEIKNFATGEVSEFTRSDLKKF